MLTSEHRPLGHPLESSDSGQAAVNPAQTYSLPHTTNNNSHHMVDSKTQDDTYKVSEPTVGDMNHSSKC